MAEAALAHGNGMLNLTTRANIQVRGLTTRSVTPFADAMVAAGLADPDASSERRRNLIVSPLAGCDPEIAPDTVKIAAAMEKLLTSDARFAVMPEKFGVAIDGGGVLPLGETGAWVHLRLRGDGAPRPGASVGYVPFKSGERGAFGFAPPFGQMTARSLRALADLAAREGVSALRVTPWRTLMFPSVAADRVDGLSAAGSAAGFIVARDDSRLRIVACPGKPACGQSSVATLADAEQLVARVPAAALVHVAGCAKGCAHPKAAPVTFVGIDGRYGIVRDGRAGDAPAAWAE